MRHFIAFTSQLTLRSIKVYDHASMFTVQCDDHHYSAGQS
jgi:hypothetical protein